MVRKMSSYDRVMSFDKFDKFDGLCDYLDYIDFLDETDLKRLKNKNVTETKNRVSDNSKIRFPRRILRDVANPLESWSDEKFRCTFRFSKDTVVNKILPLLNLKNPMNERGLPVPPMLQLLLTLKMYGACGYQNACCGDFGISQSTVSRLVKRVSKRLAETFSQFIKFPTEPDEVAAIYNGFYDIAHVPNVVGCIGCTHIPVLSPGGKSAELYRNQRGYMSLNIQAVVGPSLVIQDLVFCWPGSTHNFKVFENSSLRAKFESGQYQGFLLGDNTYTQLPYLFVPVWSDQFLTPAQQRYNNAHRQTHSVTELFFTSWKQRFPCLQQKLRSKFTTSKAIIVACAVLHNIAIECNDIVDGLQMQDYEEVPVENLPDTDQEGIDLREEFIQKNFDEEEGYIIEYSFD